VKDENGKAISVALCCLACLSNEFVKTPASTGGYNVQDTSNLCTFHGNEHVTLPIFGQYACRNPECPAVLARYTLLGMTPPARPENETSNIRDTSPITSPNLQRTYFPQQLTTSTETLLSTKIFQWTGPSIRRQRYRSVTSFPSV
jgi:hypothetical protein